MKIFCTALISIWFGFGGLAMAQQTPQEALDHGDIAEATNILQTMSASEDAEQSIAGLAGQAQIAMHNGNYAQANALLDQAQEKLSDRHLAKSGYHVVIPYLKAELAQAKEDMETARNEIKKARNNLDLDLHISEVWRGAVEYKTSLLCDNDNTLARRSAEAAILAYRSQKMHVEVALAEIQLAELEWARDKQRRTFVGYDNALRAYRSDGNSQDKIAELQLLIAEKHIKIEDFKSAAARLEMAEQDIELAGNPPELLAKLKELKQALPE